MLKRSMNFASNDERRRTNISYVWFFETKGVRLTKRLCLFFFIFFRPFLSFFFLFISNGFSDSITHEAFLLCCLFLNTKLQTSLLRFSIYIYYYYELHFYITPTIVIRYLISVLLKQKTLAHNHRNMHTFTYDILLCFKERKKKKLRKNVRDFILSLRSSISSIHILYIETNLMTMARLQRK